MKELWREHWSRVRKGRNVSAERKVGDCFQWKATGQCSKGDSCRFEPRDSFRSKSIIILFYFENADPDWQKKALKKWQTKRSKSFKIERRRTVNIFWKESARNRHVIYGNPSHAKMKSLNLDPSMVTVVISDTLRLVDGLVKGQRKVADKEQWPCWKRIFKWYVCPRTIPRGSLFCGTMIDWDRFTQSRSRRPRCATWKFGKGSIAGSHSKMRTSGASSVGSKIQGKNAKWNPQARAVRPRSTLELGNGFL